MGNKRIIGTVAGVVILAALGSLYLTLIGPSPRVDARTHEALGEAMAREALQQRGGTGGGILLIRRDTALYPNPAADAQLRAFHRALRKAGASVAATTVIKIDPLRVVNVPSADFHALLQKAAESDVIVSFLGPPVLTPGQLAKLESKRPKVVALCIGEIPRQSDLKRRFDEKLVKTAILSRRDITSASPASNASQAWFDHFFVVATEANAAELLSVPERK
jgi:hypothetical protein